MKPLSPSKKLLHIGFELSLFVKGIDGILEIFGGIMFLFISPARLSGWIHLLTYHELSEDPKDIIANMLVSLSHNFSGSLQTFVILYLIAHGLMKVLLVTLLYLKKTWAYPLCVGFLSLFIFYQVHRFLYTHSVFLLVLTLFDLIMIGLVLMEYTRVKEKVKVDEK